MHSLDLEKATSHDEGLGGIYISAYLGMNQREKGRQTEKKRQRKKGDRKKGRMKGIKHMCECVF